MALFITGLCVLSFAAGALWQYFAARDLHLRLDDLEATLDELRLRNS